MLHTAKLLTAAYRDTCHIQRKARILFQGVATGLQVFMVVLLNPQYAHPVLFQSNIHRVQRAVHPLFLLYLVEWIVEL